MAKYLLGVLSGIFLSIFLVVLLIVVVASLSGRAPGVADGSTLMLDLSGEIVERNPTNISALLFQRGLKPTLKEVHDILQKAAVDKRVNAIVVKPGGLGVGWGKTQEIRTGLEEFKKSKKPLIAYLRVAGMREYYLASAADRIYLAPEGLLDVKGLRAEAMFFKDTLSKIGVEANLEHIGKYKSFSEPFTRSNMSDAYREVVNSILDTVLGDFLATVGGARSFPKRPGKRA
jgi:protease-4